MGLCGCVTAVFALKRKELGCVKTLQNIFAKSAFSACKILHCACKIWDFFCTKIRGDRHVKRYAAGVNKSFTGQPCHHPGLLSSFTVRKQYCLGFQVRSSNQVNTLCVFLILSGGDSDFFFGFFSIRFSTGCFSLSSIP